MEIHNINDVGRDSNLAWRNACVMDVITPIAGGNDRIAMYARDVDVRSCRKTLSLFIDPGMDDPKKWLRIISCG